MNILFNSWSGAFFNPGGGEVQLLETKKHLLSRGHRVELYDQWSPQETADIFHQFSIQNGVNYPMSEYKKAGVKIALSTILWGDFPIGHPETERIRSILGLADILFTNSRAESEKISRNFDVSLDKFHETRNGISEAYLSKFTNRDFRKEFSIKGEFIISVANIDRRKNTYRLVEACQSLGKQLVLVGEVRDPIFFAEIKDQFASNFNYVGAIRDTSLLKSAYQQATVFALPSLCETPGIAALEAASQGCRIAITSIGATREYFRDDVNYVDPLDRDSIVSGIESACAKAQISTLLAERVISEYTWAAAALDVEVGYRKLSM